MSEDEPVLDLKSLLAGGRVTRRTLLAGGAFAGAAAFLAACGGDNSGDSASATTAGGSGSTASSAAGGGAASTVAGPTTTVAASNFDTNATFRFGYPFQLTNVDPHTQGSAAIQVGIFAAYDRLVHLAPDGSFLPGLAESWEVTDNGSTLVLHLRKGVKFHDGTDFDAEAVKANVNRGQTVAKSTVAPDVKKIQNVTVVDPNTVHLELVSPTASIMIAVLSGYAGCMISPAAFTTDLTQKAVGAGMYRMTDNRPDVTSYERFADYWKPDDVKAAKFEYHAIADDATRWNALQSGQLDAAVIQATELYGQFEPAGFQAKIAPTLEYTNWWHNRTFPGLDNVKVRQALMYAIDRKSIADTVFHGYAVPTVQQFPEGNAAHVADLTTDKYPYDPDKAKQMLADAGVKPGTLKWDITFATGLTTYQSLAEVLQSQMEAVGITLDIKPLGTNLAQVVFGDASAATFLSYWTGRPDPVMTLQMRSTAGQYLNPGGGSTPKMEQLVAQASQLAPGPQRDDVIHQAVTESIDQVLEVPIVFPETAVVSAKNVAGQMFYVSAKPEFRGVGIVKG
jgi:peptide/nickel transport system substrate-binding protein